LGRIDRRHLLFPRANNADPSKTEGPTVSFGRAIICGLDNMVGDAVVCGLKLAELAQSVELKEYGSVATAVKPFRLTQQKALHK